jgi:hypothetical protein
MAIHTRRRRLRYAAATGVVLVAVAATTGVARADVDPEGSVVPASVEVTVVANSYIAVLKDTPDVRQRGLSAVAAELASAAGVSVVTTFDAILGFQVTGGEAAARRLAGHPEVSWVQHNQKMPNRGSRGIPLTIDPTGLVPVVSAAERGTDTNVTSAIDRIDQRALPNSNTYSWTTTASNVTVYSIGSGVNISHSAFEGRASFGFDFVDNDADASDCWGNDSGFAGTTGSASLINGRKYGVTKGARVVAVRVADCFQSSTTATLIQGLDWVTAHAIKPAVAHVALFMPNDPAVDAAAQSTLAAGVTVVATAGIQISMGGDPSGQACNNSPGRVPGVLTLTETTTGGTTERIDSNVSDGPCVDLYAPGNARTALGTTNGEITDTIEDGGASALGAGAAALLLAVHPDWTPQQVGDAIIGNATTGVIGNRAANDPDRFLYTGP